MVVEQPVAAGQRTPRRRLRRPSRVRCWGRRNDPSLGRRRSHLERAAGAVPQTAFHTSRSSTRARWSWAESCTLSESTDGGATFRRLVVPDAGCSKHVASFSLSQRRRRIYRVARRRSPLHRRRRSHRSTPAGASAAPNGRAQSTSSRRASASRSRAARAPGKSSVRSTAVDTWTTVATAPAALSDVTFATPTTAYAVGEHETLLRSSDAGASWQARPLVLPEHAYTAAFEHIACSDALHCLMTSEPRAYGGTLVVRTSDGGATGTAVDPSEEAHIANPQVLRVSAVAISSPSTAVVVGEEGAIFVSRRRRSKVHRARLQVLPRHPGQPPHAARAIGAGRLHRLGGRGRRHRRHHRRRSQLASTARARS